VSIVNEAYMRNRKTTEVPETAPWILKNNDSGSKVGVRRSF
jgi:hypothetical protein